MHFKAKWLCLVMVMVMVMVLPILAACAPSAAPPTRAPAATPTKAAEPTKLPAPTPTPPAATPTPKPATVKIGHVPQPGYGGFYVATDKGYFKEQGITAELVDFRLSTDMIAPLGTGQLDVGGVTLGVALLSAADRGLELRVVVDMAQSRPKFESTWIVLRKDLADSGTVKTAADLKGMKIAIPSPGALGDQTVQMMLEQAGLKPGEAEVVVLPFAEQTAAFANKAIAASYMPDTFITPAIGQGLIVRWIPTSQFFGGAVQALLVVYGPALLRDQDLGRRWMIAYLKGIRDYHKAFTTGEGRGVVVNILAKYSPVKDLKLYDVMAMTYVDPNGLPDKKSIDLQHKWFVDKGLYTGKKTFDDITDLSYLDYAIQKLGRSQ